MSAQQMRERAPSRSTSLTSVRAENVVKINLENDEGKVVVKPGLACRFRVS